MLPIVRGHYKCLQQLVGVAAHLKHSAQPTYDGTIIYNDPVHTVGTMASMEFRAAIYMSFKKKQCS
jgi:hypothetical protein